MYKIMQGKYDQEACPNMKLREGTTRGNNNKYSRLGLEPRSGPTNTPITLIDAWNNLPDSIIGAGTMGTFERRLDRFWRDQEGLFDCDQQLETSSRNSGHRNVPSDSNSDLDI